MDAGKMRLPGKTAGIGALIGFALGCFVAVPWGTFLGDASPGWWLAAPLLASFTLIGAWFGTVISLDAVDQDVRHDVDAPDRSVPMQHGHPHAA